jgi:hypothetical protein
MQGRVLDCFAVSRGAYNMSTQGVRNGGLSGGFRVVGNTIIMDNEESDKQFRSSNMFYYLSSFNTLTQELVNIYDSASFVNERWITALVQAMHIKGTVTPITAFETFQPQMSDAIKSFHGKITDIEDVGSILEGTKQTYQTHDKGLHFWSKTKFRTDFVRWVDGIMSLILPDNGYPIFHQLFFHARVYDSKTTSTQMVTWSGTRPGPAALSGRSASQLCSLFCLLCPLQMQRQTFGSQPGPWSTGE